MLFYYIAFALAVIWLILCIISAVTENKPHKEAKIRNFFRRIRISLREITIVWAVVIVWLVWCIAHKSRDINGLWLCLIIGTFLVGLVILEYFRIFGIARTRKRKKRAKLKNI